MWLIHSFSYHLSCYNLPICLHKPYFELPINPNYITKRQTDNMWSQWEHTDIKLVSNSAAQINLQQHTNLQFVSVCSLFLTEWEWWHFMRYLVNHGKKKRRRSYFSAYTISSPGCFPGSHYCKTFKSTSPSWLVGCSRRIIFRLNILFKNHSLSSFGEHSHSPTYLSTKKRLFPQSKISVWKGKVIRQK